MTEYFPEVKKVKYEGPNSKNPLAFKHYNPKQKIMGKTMAEHLRFAVCYWHTFKGLGADPFGANTILRSYNKAADPMQRAEQTMQAAFEFFTKLGVDFWCFHDRDIAPEADTLAETNKRLDKIVKLAKKLQKDTGVKLLWGTDQCLLASALHGRGGHQPQSRTSSPTPPARSRRPWKSPKNSAVQAMSSGAAAKATTPCSTPTWSGRLDHLAMLLHMAVDYKKKIGFKGQLYIEPKPKEPTKHQYDFDAGNCLAFLQKYGLADDFKLNIEANHATLAGAHVPSRAGIFRRQRHPRLGRRQPRRRPARLGYRPVPDRPVRYDAGHGTPSSTPAASRPAA